MTSFMRWVAVTTAFTRASTALMPTCSWPPAKATWSRKCNRPKRRRHTCPVQGAKRARLKTQVATSPQSPEFQPPGSRLPSPLQVAAARAPRSSRQSLHLPLESPLPHIPCIRPARRSCAYTRSDLEDPLETTDPPQSAAAPYSTRLHCSWDAPEAASSPLPRHRPVSQQHSPHQSSVSFPRYQLFSGHWRGILQPLWHRSHNRRAEHRHWPYPELPAQIPAPAAARIEKSDRHSA